MAYASDEQVALAAKLGYEVTRSHKYGHRFQKGGRRIWSLYQGWQSADLVDGQYINHKPYQHLEGALTRDLSDEEREALLKDY